VAATGSTGCDFPLALYPLSFIIRSNGGIGHKKSLYWDNVHLCLVVASLQFKESVVTGAAYQVKLYKVNHKPKYREVSSKPQATMQQTQLSLNDTSAR